VPDVNGMLGTAQRTLEGQAALDATLGELAGRLADAATQVGDVALDLSRYLDALDADPARLQEVYERRAALRSLTRKYAEDIDGVLAWAEHARTRLGELDTSDEVLEELDRERRRLALESAELAAKLRASRREAAQRFSAAVTAELTGLAMPHARVEVAIAPKPAGGGPTLEVAGEPAGVGPDGADDVELRLLAHPGAPSLALQKGASGGELSRVMLAIEVVFAGAGGPPTLVFDEVDAGVGGRAAVEIGRRLARLARDHQVFVVTHLPQVAAFADRHLVVAKDTDGAVTTSGVRVVEDTERSRELARMLAGLPDSDLGIAHAEELLAVATREKRG
jgi:DNA repair protein RecN (Recombination protein N)